MAQWLRALTALPEVLAWWNVPEFLEWQVRWRLRIDVSLRLTWATQQDLKNRPVDVAQLVEFLPSIHETVGLMPNVA